MDWHAVRIVPAFATRCHVSQAGSRPILPIDVLTGLVLLHLHDGLFMLVEADKIEVQVFNTVFFQKVLTKQAGQV